MQLFMIFFVLASITATSLSAMCAGHDVRELMTPGERASVSARLAETPFATGNHWVARKNQQTFHIVGTMHLADPRLDPIVDNLRPVIEQADRIYLEATDAEEAQLEQSFTTRPELFFLHSGPTLPELLDEELWSRMQVMARARDLPGFMVAKMQPWYVSLLLAIPACAMAQLKEGEAGLDGMIMDIARETDIPMQALEPYDTLFNLMANDPLDEQVEMLSLGILPEHVIEDMHRTLLNSYFEQKAAEVFEINRVFVRKYVNVSDAEFDALMDEMLDELLAQRNLAWMKTLLAAPGGVSVVAVGAGHLPGTSGVLNLLKEAGYTLEQRSF